MPSSFSGSLGSLDVFDGREGATLDDIANAVQDSLKRPDLLIARIKVVKGLDQTKVRSSRKVALFFRLSLITVTERTSVHRQRNC
jgi:hypothetical protein